MYQHMNLSTREFKENIKGSMKSTEGFPPLFDTSQVKLGTGQACG